MNPFAFHNNLRPKWCHTCPNAHPLDVISFVSRCPSCNHLIQSYIQCCPPSLDTVVAIRWSQTSQLEDKRNFVQGPHTIVPILRTHNPPGGRSKAAHGRDFKRALSARTTPLPNALYRTLKWLEENPRHCRSPPRGPEPMAQTVVAV